MPVHGRTILPAWNACEWWGGRSFRLPPDDDPEKSLQRGGFHAHGRGAGDAADSVRDGAVLRLIRRILPEPCGAAHPHIDHDRVPVTRDGTGKGVRLQPVQPVESHPGAAIRRSDMGAQSLRRDALRVLVRLRLIVRPSHAGRERGDNAARDFHVPSGRGAQRISERASLIVPPLGGAQVEQRSLREERDEVADGSGVDGVVTGVGGGAVHACIVPYRPPVVNAHR